MSQSEAPRGIADFDSASAMVRALGRFLHGRDFPNLGMSLLPEALSGALPAVGAAMNHLPDPVKRFIYIHGGRNEAVPPCALGDLDAEEVASWIVDQYPRQRYPAAFVGSSNGAMIHLAAALGIPWIPQTFLIPVRRDGDPHEPIADLEWGRAAGRALLEANPTLALHQMHDPNQDLLMVRSIAYFRVKWLALPAAYRRFLDGCLEPGAP